MTDKIDDGGPAFPRSGSGIRCAIDGMSLRDWFAGQALQWAGHGEWFSQDPKHAAERAYKMADAMLEARAKGGGK